MRTSIRLIITDKQAFINYAMRILKLVQALLRQRMTKIITLILVHMTMLKLGML